MPPLPSSYVVWILETTHFTMSHCKEYQVSSQTPPGSLHFSKKRRLQQAINFKLLKATLASDTHTAIHTCPSDLLHSHLTLCNRAAAISSNPPLVLPSRSSGSEPTTLNYTVDDAEIDWSNSGPDYDIDLNTNHKIVTALSILRHCPHAAVCVIYIPRHQ